MTTSAQRGLKGPPSPRQNEVLLLVGQGLTNIEIGERLGIGPRTVKQHVSKLTVKFGVKKKRELIPIAQGMSPVLPPRTETVVVPDETRALIDKGHSDKEIAEWLGVTKASVVKARRSYQKLALEGGTQ